MAPLSRIIAPQCLQHRFYQTNNNGHMLDKSHSSVPAPGNIISAVFMTLPSVVVNII
jgi:hypothetical protein